MKRIIQLTSALLLTFSFGLSTAYAQAPEKMSYQAVVRNASSTLVTSTTVGMQISILQGSAAGIAVYVETQNPTTNANGLISLEIGTGTTTDDFTTINWANGPYFIKTETDPTGGTTYTITGTSQLLSVPYALHAKTAESITGGITETDPVYTASQAANITASNITILGNTSGTNTGDQDGSETKVTAGTNVTVTGTGTTVSPYVVNSSVSTDSFYLGQDTLGGIVYYIYKDATGTQHGLIVSKTESTATWQTTVTLTNADRTEDGAFNTALMTSSAAATYVSGLGAGWYLPSIDELGLLYYNRFSANKYLRAGGFTLISKTVSYWSSTEFDTGSAFFFNFGNGSASNGNKAGTSSVRAVRAF